MLPLLEKEAAERRNATARLERDRAGKLKPVSQKIDSQGKSDNATPAAVVQSPAIFKVRNENKAAAEAAKLTGTNRDYVAQAKKLKEQAPQQFERLKAGRVGVLGDNPVCSLIFLAGKG